MRYDARTAECLILTFKEGLLSPVAHDLKLRVGRFEIAVEEAPLGVSARFDTASLEVMCARQGGRDAPGLLRESDKRKIERNVREEVLHAARYPEARFASTSVAPHNGGFEIHGQLTLHGTTRELSLVARREGGHLCAEVTLHQPDFGIQPYRAAFGTLRVQADVRVVIRVPHEGSSALS